MTCVTLSRSCIRSLKLKNGMLLISVSVCLYIPLFNCLSFFLQKCSCKHFLNVFIFYLFLRMHKLFRLK